MTDRTSPPIGRSGLVADPPAAAQPPLPAASALGYSLANLGYGAFYAFNNATLPLFLGSFTRNAVLLGLMGSTHSIEGAVIQPVVGSASDRLRTRWGRRRPFMALFTPLSALFLVLTPLAGRARQPSRLGAIVLCIFLFTVLFNIAFDPYQALLPDITPENQRGRVTGIWALLGVSGQAAILLISVPLAVKFTLVAVAMVATTALTCVAVREPRSSGVARSKRRGELVRAIEGLGTLQEAAKGIGVFFFSGLGVGAVLPFLTLFVKRITNCSDHQAEEMFFVLMIFTAVGMLPFGWLTDRVSARRVLFVGLALIGIAAAYAYRVRTLSQIAVALAIAGLGNAAQSASAYPLLTELVPSEEVGFYTGLQTTALSVAQPATVVVTGLLVRHGTFRMIFVVCAVNMIAALYILSRIRLRAAVEQIAARRRSLPAGGAPA